MCWSVPGQAWVSIIPLSDILDGVMHHDIEPPHQPLNDLINIGTVFVSLNVGVAAL